MSGATPVIIPLRTIQIGSTQLITGAAPIPASTPTSRASHPHIIFCSVLHLAVSEQGIAVCYQGRNDATVTPAVITTWPPVKAKKSLSESLMSPGPKKPANALHGLDIYYQPQAPDRFSGGVILPHIRLAMEFHDRIRATIEGTTSGKIIHVEATMDTQYLSQFETSIQPYNITKPLKRGVSRWVTTKHTNPYFSAHTRTFLKVSSIMLETMFVICLLVELYAHMPRIITFFISGFFRWIQSAGNSIWAYFVALYTPYHDAYPILSTLTLVMTSLVSFPFLAPFVISFLLCYALSNFTVHIVLAMTVAQHAVAVLMQTRKTYKLMLLYGKMAYNAARYVTNKTKGGGGAAGGGGPPKLHPPSNPTPAVKAAPVPAPAPRPTPVNVTPAKAS